MVFRNYAKPSDKRFAELLPDKRACLFAYFSACANPCQQDSHVYTERHTKALTR